MLTIFDAAHILLSVLFSNCEAYQSMSQQFSEILIGQADAWATKNKEAAADAPEIITHSYNPWER